MGAPIGNQNAKKNKDWESAIRRALAREHGNVDKGLDHIAQKFIEAVENGEAWAIKEFGDRIEGKPGQAVQVSGDPDNPIINTVERIVVKAADSDG